MSSLYECVVTCGPEDEVRAAFDGLDSPLPLALGKIADDVFAVYVTAGRDVPFNPPEDEKVARALSSGLGRSLLVLYDDRCGLRYSALCEGGELVREFGETDEIWVALDEQGDPMIDGRRYRWEEIEDDEEGEYETIVNAIDAGLDALGVPEHLDSSRLRQKVCYGFE